ncbi:MAG: type I-F CRISPR-associated protein Csy1, partial [Desulfamplus sp.]|nr:type I-F CRISPR-associated protein Csy1 [Desulfamplus sp.]
MDREIKEFFEERKEAWLKSKIKSNTPPDEEQKIREQCEEKFYLDNWLLDAAKRADQLFIST